MEKFGFEKALYTSAAESVHEISSNKLYDEVQKKVFYPKTGDKKKLILTALKNIITIVMKRILIMPLSIQKCI